MRLGQGLRAQEQPWAQGRLVRAGLRGVRGILVLGPVRIRACWDWG